jgi:Thioesterase-like superfamily
MCESAMNDRAFFKRRADGSLEPGAGAASNWDSGRTVRGMAVSALLARAAEDRVSGLPLYQGLDLRPARWTVDLSQPVRMSPCRVSATILRAGRRLCLVDAELQQEGSVRARARGIFVRGEDVPPSQAWAPEEELPPLPPLLSVGGESRWYWSESVGWTARAAPHMNRERKQVWQRSVDVVEDEEPSPFQLVAAAADLASLVAHWSTDGLLHINADISLNLARLPSGGEVGLVAANRAEHNGVAIGAALVRDRNGVLGTSIVSSLAGRERVVDPRSRDTPSVDST